MEPPPFGDGNSAAAGPTLSQPFLQWSHRLLAMVTGKIISLSRVGIALQWSHRLLAMVTGVDHRSLDVAGPPSMEPPPFGDGNSSSKDIRWVAVSLLQWSHRLLAMVTGL